jgi:hypothetical protein
VRDLRALLAISAILIVSLVAAPGSAAAFGTIDGGGQNREHERITRAALSCAGAGSTEENCFEPRTIDSLAGHAPQFGEVGSPDSDELSLPAAHCDDGDFLAVDNYPRSRAQANEALLGCLAQLRSRFDEGVARAADLVDDQGNIIPTGVSLDTDCKTGREEDSRAKCMTIEGFGRALHGAQDFYAHSNWADAADPTRPIGADNPPGLNLPGPSPLLDLRGDQPPTIPADLTTGCYAVRDQIPGVGDCLERVTHAALNKDRGLINPETGSATNPTTPRGMVGDNFAKAVTGAIAETRRQWQDFQSALTGRYGKTRGETMICALTRDDPVNECRGWSWRSIAGIVLIVGVGIAAVVLIVRQRRHRSSRSGDET